MSMRPSPTFTDPIRSPSEDRPPMARLMTSCDPQNGRGKTKIRRAAVYWVLSSSSPCLKSFSFLPCSGWKRREDETGHETHVEQYGGLLSIIIKSQFLSIAHLLRFFNPTHYTDLVGLAYICLIWLYTKAGLLSLPRSPVYFEADCIVELFILYTLPHSLHLRQCRRRA
ncbi:hypothetical protein TNCV_3217611 [Trichonephila clavipes]|nr:hypothetical protein TNCV_3217611 [Trichonephila clavipes]